MPSWTGEWLVFVGVMALGQFSPGPDMLLLTRTALASGRRAGCWTAIGIVCGIAFHAAIAVTGVATLLEKGGWIGTTLMWLAVVYLVWLAIQLIRSGLKAGRMKVGDSTMVSDTSYASWKRGLFCNLLNPKVAIFLAGVTAPFLVIPDSTDGWPLILWATIVIEGLILWFAWVFLLQVPMIRERYLKAAHWFDLAFGLALLGVAGLLIFTA